MSAVPTFGSRASLKTTMSLIGVPTPFLGSKVSWTRFALTRMKGMEAYPAAQAQQLEQPGRLP
jgi:hypothetical protein